MTINQLFNVSGYGAIVTGGASGIGLGLVEAMAENGASVTMVDIDAETIKVEVERLRAKGFDVRGEVADVTDHAALDAAFDNAAVAHGRLDVVFANAGIDSGPGFVDAWAGSDRPRDPAGAIESYTTERWNRAIDVNLNGIFATIRAGARHLRPNKSGRIIVTTSLAAIKNETVVGAAYMAAKAGCAHLVRNVALELAADGITVNAIAPGFFVTNIGGGHAKNLDLQAAVAKDIPMHRVGFPDDIKALALFLASPGSSYVTGQQIVVDGGWGLGIAD